MFKKLCALLLALLMLGANLAYAAEVPFVRAGGSFGLAVSEDGVVWGWGDNASGQLGTGTSKRSHFPAPAAVGIDGSQVADIQCGNVSTLFLMKDGTVYTCGHNSYGQQGIGNKKTTHVFKPVQVPGLENIVKISSGFGQCMALTADGQVYVWGRNSNGQIGNGTRKNVYSPLLLELENIVDIQCGGKFCIAMAENGDIYGWGTNEHGQLGDVSKYTNVLTPTKLPFSGQYTAIACGSKSVYGIDAEGVLWAWGRNDYYQLGSKEVGQRTKTPVRVALPEDVRVTEVIAYNSHVIAMTAEGGVWQWGSTYHGQVGNKTRLWRSLPSEACPVNGVIGADVGSLQSYIIQEDGTLWGCGCNEYGQTGAYKKARYYVDTWSYTGLNLKTGVWEAPGND